jgi:methylated-DNA-protein-cysteine methyltransferase related protein
MKDRKDRTESTTLSIPRLIPLEHRSPDSTQILIWKILREQIAKEVTAMSSYTAIYAVVRQIPPGKVATYGQIAQLANLPGQARLVGYALYQVDASAEIPWHRVINAKGEISYSPFRNGADYLQRSLLEQEGVQFNPEGKVNLREYLWQLEQQK